jgi:hypothetical protein
LDHVERILNILVSTQVVTPHGAQAANVATFAPIGAVLVEVMPQSYLRKGAGAEYGRVSTLAGQTRLLYSRGVHADDDRGAGGEVTSIAVNHLPDLADTVVAAWRALAAPAGVADAARRVADARAHRRRFPAPPTGNRRRSAACARPVARRLAAPLVDCDADADLGVDGVLLAGSALERDPVSRKTRETPGFSDF